VKIDVEGYELEVLAGAEETLRTLHPVLIVEVPARNRKKAREILTSHGYSMKRIKRKGHDFLAVYDPNL